MKVQGKKKEEMDFMMILLILSFIFFFVRRMVGRLIGWSVGLSVIISQKGRFHIPAPIGALFLPF